MEETRYKIYLLGQGRLGRQLSRYFKYLNEECEILSRTDFLAKIKKSSSDQLQNSPSTNLPSALPLFLLAISDPDVPSVVQDIRECLGTNPVIVHFSASHKIPNAFGFHPLYSFTNRDLSLQELKTVPFVCDKGEKKFFHKFLPYIKNPVFELNSSKGPRYHALAVALANLPILVSQYASSCLNGEGLPKTALIPLLESVLNNFSVSSGEIASGPLGRKDSLTLDKHLKALKDDLFLKKIYSLAIEKEWPGYFAKEKHSLSSELNIPKETP